MKTADICFLIIMTLVILTPICFLGAMLYIETTDIDPGNWAIHDNKIAFVVCEPLNNICIPNKELTDDDYMIISYYSEENNKLDSQLHIVRKDDLKYDGDLHDKMTNKYINKELEIKVINEELLFMPQNP